MRYEIESTIAHDYGAPSDHARTMVRLLPSNLDGRQVIGARLLTIDPAPSERRDITDFFGNKTTVLSFHAAIDHIAVTLRARAERLAPRAALDLSPTVADLRRGLAGGRALGPRAPHHFLGPSPRIARDQAIADWAAGLIAPGMTAVQAVGAVGEAVHATMQFAAGATDVDTPAAEAFARRVGVCQDFSHIMITALRSAGIPAGYVSGFLRTLPPPGQPRLEGADAMHAWVSAWCGGDAGWIEYDPTNAAWVALDHVVVAYGRDYGDVAPIKGALRTAGQQQSRNSVDVRPLPAGAANAP